MDMMIFAKRLKAVREERNVTATELAEALGVNKTNIYRYETGAFKALKADLLHGIADYLGVNPDYLIGATDNKHPVTGAEELLDDITDGEQMLLDLFPDCS